MPRDPTRGRPEHQDHPRPPATAAWALLEAVTPTGAQADVALRLLETPWRDLEAEALRSAVGGSPEKVTVMPVPGEKDRARRFERDRAILRGKAFLVKGDLRAARREMGLARARGAEDREFQELCRDLEARDPSPAEPEGD